MKSWEMIVEYFLNWLKHNWNKWNVRQKLWFKFVNCFEAMNFLAHIWNVSENDWNMTGIIEICVNVSELYL